VPDAPRRGPERPAPRPARFPDAAGGPRRPDGRGPGV